MNYLSSAGCVLCTCTLKIGQKVYFSPKHFCDLFESTHGFGKSHRLNMNASRKHGYQTMNLKLSLVFYFLVDICSLYVHIYEQN